MSGELKAGKSEGMRVFISSDIEGTAGITGWEETDHRKGSPWYAHFCRQMTLEAAAACEGALAAGATDILVKDAHDTGCNIDPSGLPAGVRINRGWSGGPFVMVDGLDGGFDAVAFTGYHSPAYGAGNPLAHTMREEIEELTINGARASEFTIHSYIAGMLGVPVIFVSGDHALCEQAQKLVPAITAVPVCAGVGASSTSIHPGTAVNEIRAGMERALSGDVKRCLVEMPAHFEVVVRYRAHPMAYRFGFYPGAQQVDEKSIMFAHRDYYEVLRFFNFVL